jgi:hypothetical protein
MPENTSEVFGWTREPSRRIDAARANEVQEMVSQTRGLAESYDVVGLLQTLELNGDLLQQVIMLEELSGRTNISVSRLAGLAYYMASAAPVATCHCGADVFQHKDGNRLCLACNGRPPHVSCDDD